MPGHQSLFRKHSPVLMIESPAVHPTGVIIPAGALDSCTLNHCLPSEFSLKALVAIFKPNGGCWGRRKAKTHGTSDESFQLCVMNWNKTVELVKEFDTHVMLHPYLVSAEVRPNCLLKDGSPFLVSYRCQKLLTCYGNLPFTSLTLHQGVSKCDLHLSRIS